VKSDLPFIAGDGKYWKSGAWGVGGLRYAETVTSIARIRELLVNFMALVKRLIKT
jgi:hypothetical protein